MEVNKALSALLRLTEIDDLVRQLAHLSRKTLVGFPAVSDYLFSTTLLRGFSLIIEPVVDFQLANSRSMQIHLVFILPELANTTAICTLEKLVPLSYQLDTHCFGGTITRTDLLLLSCADKPYVIAQTELEQCFKAESIFFFLPGKRSVPSRRPCLVGIKMVCKLSVFFQPRSRSVVSLFTRAASNSS